MIAQLDEIVCSTAVDSLAEAARDFYRRGWVLGSSGNFSAKLQDEPVRVAISRSGVDKGTLTPEDFLVVDRTGAVTSGIGRPSAETAIHLAIMRATRAASVLHTHSVCATILSQRNAQYGGMAISGYEMLKGLAGVRSHAHREWLPVLDNSQDYGVLAREVETALARSPGSHGLLLKAHGLYTWGADVAEARRHVEILEFLLEVLTRWPS
jgi:methylthioribulose-1-phosphate dehydratase